MFMNKDVLSFIEKSASLAVDLETELTKRKALSPVSGGVGEKEKCDWLESWLRGQGITDLERYDADDDRVPSKIRPNLVATIKGKKPERLWIMSHLDVVPVGALSLWESDPWTVVQKTDPRYGDVLIGRGVEDNQGGLVSSVIAALAFVKNGIVPERTLKLLFVADEENASHWGIEYLIKHHPTLFRKTDSALVPDSGDQKGETIEIAEKSSVWLKVIVRGLQAHASRPDQGNNAALAAAALTVKMYSALHGRFCKKDPLFEPDYSTFQPTKKEANVENINTIPGLDVFHYDMRI
jgi:succinyl-diaminopimelate desuccinylase